MSVMDDRLSRSKRTRKVSDLKVQAASSEFEFDEVLLSQGRLGIVSALLVAGRMDFVEMKKLLSMSAGNLSVHAAKLESKGYLLIEKDFAGKSPRTTYVLTPTGRRALITHVERLSHIVREQSANRK